MKLLTTGRTKKCAKFFETSCRTSGEL